MDNSINYCKFNNSLKVALKFEHRLIDIVKIIYGIK